MVSEDILLKDTGAQLSAEGRKMLTALYAAMRSLRLYPLENQVAVEDILPTYIGPGR